MKWLIFGIILGLIGGMWILSGCAGPTPPTVNMTPQTSSPSATGALTLSSMAFKNNEKIPDKYTCQGANISPRLSWNDPPAQTQSLALITEDLDGPSGIITHWIIFNIPAASRELAEGLPAQAQLPDGTLQGNNVRGQPGYYGPCPPAGSSHRYRFTLYALEQAPDIKSGANRTEFLSAIQGHIIAQAQLLGTYQR